MSTILVIASAIGKWLGLVSHQKKLREPRIGDTFEANDAIPRSGLYLVIHEGPHTQDRESFCMVNRDFPLCDICGNCVRFKFMKAVDLITDDENFQGPVRHVIMQ